VALPLEGAISLEIVETAFWIAASLEGEKL
jgi:hypothetical protein